MPGGDPRRYTRALKQEYRPRLKEFRQKLITAREEANLRQVTVALMLGRPQSYISKIEKTGKVNFVLMERLAAIYDKPLDYFCTLPLGTRVGEKFLGLTHEEWEFRTRVKIPAMQKDKADRLKYGLGGGGDIRRPTKTRRQCEEAARKEAEVLAAAVRTSG